MNFAQKLASYIQTFGMRNNFRRLENWRLEKDSIVGQFLGISAGEIAAFDFTVSDRGLEYQTTDRRNDSYFYGLLVGAEVNPFLVLNGGSSAAYAQGRLDKAIKRCTVGSNCGNSCIEKSDKCRISSPLARQHGKRLVGVAKASGAAELRSGSSVKATTTASTKAKITPQELTKVLHKEEDAVRFDSHETAIIINPETGETIARKGGGKTNVDFRYDEVKKWKGAILTHNHPWTENEQLDNKGVGFSAQDLHASCVAELSEVRAVTSHYRFSLKPPKEGWNEQYFSDKIAPSYNKHRQAVYLEGVEKVRKIPDRQSAIKEGWKLEEEWAHETVKRVAQELGMEYKRENIKNINEKAIVEERWNRLNKLKRRENLKQLAVLGVLGAAYAAAILSQMDTQAKRDDKFC